MSQYTITAVQRREEWPSKYGPMVVYALGLEGEEGWILLNQRPETPPPQKGQTITGEIKVVNPRDGEAFKKIQKEYAGNQQQSLAGSQETYIVQMLEELTGRRPVQDTNQTTLEDPFANL